MDRIPDEHLFHYEPDRPHDWNPLLVDPRTAEERRRERKKLFFILCQGIVLFPVLVLLAAVAALVGCAERAGRALR